MHLKKPWNAPKWCGEIVGCWGSARTRLVKFKVHRRPIADADMVCTPFGKFLDPQLNYFRSSYDCMQTLLQFFVGRNQFKLDKKIHQAKQRTLFWGFISEAGASVSRISYNRLSCINLGSPSLQIFVEKSLWMHFLTEERARLSSERGLNRRFESSFFQCITISGSRSLIAFHRFLDCSESTTPARLISFLMSKSAANINLAKSKSRFIKAT